MYTKTAESIPLKRLILEGTKSTENITTPIVDNSVKGFISDPEAVSEISSLWGVKLIKNEKGKVQKIAHIPPQTPPAGGKSAEAGRILSPRQIVSPCLVRISIFNHLDFARNSFELCPTNTAKI